MRIFNDQILFFYNISIKNKVVDKWPNIFAENTLMKYSPNGMLMEVTFYPDNNSNIG